MVLAKRVVGISILLAALLAALIAPSFAKTVSAQQGQTNDETCPKVSPWTKVDDQSAADENNNKNKVTWTAPEGYVIEEVCVKGGQDKAFFDASGNNGCWKVYGVGSQTATAKKIGDGSQCKDISHASFKVGLDDEKTYFQFAKEWKGDTVEGADVTFMIGDVSWNLGDLPVPVEPGQVLEPLSEVVTGLPENCSYTSDLPESFTVPGNNEAVQLNSIVIDEPKEGEPTVYTLTATNTVVCEDDEPGEVLGEVTEKPVGGVSAGAGGVSASNLPAIAGVVASVATLGSGLVLARKWNT